jgi:hypothetical protein
MFGRAPKSPAPKLINAPFRAAIGEEFGRQEWEHPTGEGRVKFDRKLRLGDLGVFREASHLAKAPAVRREELFQVPWKSIATTWNMGGVSGAQ